MLKRCISSAGCCLTKPASRGIRARREHGSKNRALRDLLKLYCDEHDHVKRKEIEGLRSAQSRPIIRRLATSGPITFALGLEVTVTFDEQAFEGTGIFILGSVLERFFARYVAINSFTETIIKSQQRGEIIRWQTQPGKRQIL